MANVACTTWPFSYIRCVSTSLDLLTYKDKLKMIDKMIARVKELKIPPEEQADMLAELVVQLNKEREYLDDTHKEKYLWSYMWGARYHSKRLIWPIDRPDRNRDIMSFDDIELTNDKLLGTNNVQEVTDYDDFFVKLGLIVKDIVDVKIISGKLDGLSVDEIAESLGVTPKTVWLRLDGLKARFKKLV